MRTIKIYILNIPYIIFELDEINWTIDLFLHFFYFRRSSIFFFTKLNKYIEFIFSKFSIWQGKKKKFLPEKKEKDSSVEKQLKKNHPKGDRGRLTVCQKIRWYIITLSFSFERSSYFVLLWSDTDYSSSKTMSTFFCSIDNTLSVNYSRVPVNARVLSSWRCQLSVSCRFSAVLYSIFMDVFFISLRFCFFLRQCSPYLVS